MPKHLSNRPFRFNRIHGLFGHSLVKHHVREYFWNLSLRESTLFNYRYGVPALGIPEALNHY